MTLAEIAQYALTAIITGAPVAVALGALGTGIETVGAKRGWRWMERAGQVLEAIFSDLPKAIRGSRATKLQAELELLKGSGPKTPRTGSVPPSAAGLLVFLAALAGAPNLVACSSTATPEARPPTLEELQRMCPSAARVMSIDCPALALAKCGDAKSLDECAAKDAVEAECDALIDAEVAKCN
jgi:hypothetical protein